MNFITLREIVRNAVLDKLNKAFISTQILISKSLPYREFDIKNLRICSKGILFFDFQYMGKVVNKLKQ